MDTVQLEKECRTYARYLTGCPATPYVISKYLDFHLKMGNCPADRFDRFLLSISARSPLWARLADSYATVWRKNSLLRRKLVLTLGLVECAPPTFEKLDRVPPGGWFGTVAQLAIGASSWLCSLLAATVLFSPVRLWKAIVRL